MNSQSDLLVLGAGPAGCAAAITARQAGMSVVVLEAEERARRTPGETLHPGVQPVLERLGVMPAVLGAGFVRHRGVWVDWVGPAAFRSYGSDAAGPWRGFQAERARLHDVLRAEVVRRGATLVTGARPVSVLFATGARVAGVSSDRDLHRARWTLDATGRRAWLAQTLRTAPRLASPAMRARFGWTSAGERSRLSEPSLKATADGWSWRAPLADRREAWVSLTVGPLDPAKGRRSEGGVEVGWRLHPACAMPGHILAGDAACLPDPSSSHGVLRALMSGMLAAHLVGRCRLGDYLEATAAQTYRGWMQAQFEADIRAMGDFYRQQPSPMVAEAFEPA